MKQTLGVTVQRHNRVVGVIALLCVVQGYEEGCLLNGIQSLLVLTAAEVSVTSIGPGRPAGQVKSANAERVLGRGGFLQPMTSIPALWCHLPVTCGECCQLLLPWLGRRLVGQDLFHLLLYLSWKQEPAIIKHPHLEKAALVIHNYVFGFIRVLKGVWEVKAEGKETEQEQTEKISRHVSKKMFCVFLCEEFTSFYSKTDSYLL